MKASGGAFLRMREKKLLSMGKLIAYEKKVIPGPASAVAMAGFFVALRKNKIKNGETVLINLGEGPNRHPTILNR